jgi:hypothetical protein
MKDSIASLAAARGANGKPDFEVTDEDPGISEWVEPIINGLIALVCVFGFLYTAGVFNVHADEARQNDVGDRSKAWETNGMNSIEQPTYGHGNIISMDGRRSYRTHTNILGG